MTKKTDAERLLEYLKLREDSGDTTTKTRVRRDFNWIDGKLETVLAQAVKEIRTETWGYLKIISASASPAKKYQKEEELYVPIVNALKDVNCSWLARKHFSTVFPFNTSSRRATNADPQLGKWSNPDVTLVFFHRLDFQRKDLLEVMTFEVKHASKQLDITAVYEALAHRRGATMSYLFVYYDSNTPIDDQLKEVLCKEAGKHGIGIVVTKNIEDSNTWEELLSARRVDTDPYDIEAFLSAKLIETEQQQIRTLSVR